MTINNYALLSSSEVVENIVVWDGNTETWQPPAGTTAIEVTEATGPAYIGGTYANGVFSPPADTSQS
ncbi:hypothetical protein [Paraburkholderia tropica]|uniref:hypothetical protein n=1 Tax=Paraburkholderia tropica TaxID=92647 RepID=UPI002AB61DE3|nr:hypothetical protein [Paraburkholderia tropica]